MCRTGQSGVHHLTTTAGEQLSENEPEEDDFMMDELTTPVPSKEWNIHLNIDRRRVKFKVDTGAQCNVISEELFNTLEGNQGNKTMLKSSKVTLTSFSGHKIKHVGQCTLLCEYKNKYHNIDFQVLW